VGVCNLSPQLRDFAILLTTKSIAELRNYDYGPSKFDFRNSATLCILLPVPLLSSPFSSAQDVFKNQPKIFLELPVSLETTTCLKETVAQDFLPSIFFHESTGFHGQKCDKNCGSEALKLQTQKKCDCGVAVAEQHFF
jgi:hypothetical protein